MLLVISQTEMRNILLETGEVFHVIKSQETWLNSFVLLGGKQSLAIVNLGISLKRLPCKVSEVWPGFSLYMAKSKRKEIN